MKILIWIIVAIVVVGGLAWFLSSGNEESTNSLDENQESIDPLSENSRVLESEDEVFAEIEDSLDALE